MSIRGCPFFIRGNQLCPTRSSRSAGTFVQAGLLTFGSSYGRTFPTMVSGDVAAFVPDYSGGPVPDLHGVPFSARYEHLINSGIQSSSSDFVKYFLSTSSLSRKKTAASE
jgi:hypothetical protein